jgi:putative DNA methylase
VSQALVKTKPSFLEAGLPCASLSAECQRDNNARQRPPQNRLHIWWARRPPTICRAAILAALLPHDLQLDESVLPSLVDEPTAEDLDNLPPKLQPHYAFFKRLITEVSPTTLTREHQYFLRVMGIIGDADRAWRRLAQAEGANNGRDIILGSTWGYRYERAFALSPSDRVLSALHQTTREALQLGIEDQPVLLDFMAGGGSIPLEGIRYGLKVFANELNPVAVTILKGTLEYPSRFGRDLVPNIQRYAQQIGSSPVNRGEVHL